MTGFIRGANIAAMKLDAYIRETGTSETALARATGFSQSYINKVRNGRANPTLAFMQRVADATEGAVSANDFMSVSPSLKRKGEAA